MPTSDPVAPSPLRVVITAILTLLGPLLLFPLLLSVDRVLLHSERDIRIRFTPDGEHLLRSSTLGAAVFSTATGRVLVQLDARPTEFEDTPTSIALTRDARWVATGYPYGRVSLWDGRTGERIVELLGLSSSIYTLEFSPGDELIAGGSRDGTVMIWSVPDGSPRQEFRHPEDASQIAFSPDGELLAVGGIDGERSYRFQIHRVSSGELVQERAGDGFNFVRELVFSPDGGTVAIAGASDRLDLWDWTTEAPPLVLRCRAIRSESSQRGRPQYSEQGLAPARSPCFSPGGEWIACAASSTIDIWDFPTGGTRMMFVVDNEPRALAIGDQGRLLVAYKLGVVQAWDPVTGTRMWSRSGLALEPEHQPWRAFLGLTVWLGVWIAWSIRGGNPFLAMSLGGLLGMGIAMHLWACFSEPFIAFGGLHRSPFHELGGAIIFSLASWIALVVVGVRQGVRRGGIETWLGAFALLAMAVATLALQVHILGAMAAAV